MHAFCAFYLNASLGLFDCYAIKIFSIFLETRYFSVKTPNRHEDIEIQIKRRLVQFVSEHWPDNLDRSDAAFPSV